MNGKDLTGRGHDPPEGDGFDRFLNDLRAPLSVIHAYTQLLQRRILRRRVYNEKHLLERLAVIERSAKTIGTRLKEHEDHHNHTRP